MAEGRKLILAVGLAACLAPGTESQDLFQRYKVAGTAAGQQGTAQGVEAVDLVIERRRPNEALGRFHGRIRAAAKGRANFAGRVAIVRWSCGFVCQDGVLLDVRTGRLTWMPFTVSDCQYIPGELMSFRPDSRLLIVKGGLEWKEPPPEGGADEDCRVRYFEWTGTRFRTVDDPGARKPNE